MWVLVPGTYEKWTHPGNKNDKHYRAIYRSPNGGRRIGNRKFKRVSDLVVFSNRFHARVCKNKR